MLEHNKCFDGRLRASFHLSKANTTTFCTRDIETFPILKLPIFCGFKNYFVIKIKAYTSSPSSYEHRARCIYFLC